MITPCVLRMFPEGEIIKSYLNTETVVVSNIPESIFTFPIKGEMFYTPKYASISNLPKDSDNDTFGKLEKLLLDNPSFIFGCAVGKLGFYAQNGKEVFTTDTEMKNFIQVYNNEEYELEDCHSIGIKATKRICMSSKPYQEEITYLDVMGKVLTSTGFVSLGDIDVNHITPIPKPLDIDVTRSLNSSNHFGIIWIDGVAKKVDLVNGVLKVIE